MKQYTVPLISLTLIIAAFFGGMYYATPTNTQQAGTDEQNGRNFRNRPGGQGFGKGFGGGMVTGSVLSLDATSMTVTLPEGGSKIVILSQDTKVSHTTESTLDAVKVGDTVSVMGTPNQDGSVTAQRIETGAIMRFNRQTDRVQQTQ